MKEGPGNKQETGRPYLAVASGHDSAPMSASVGGGTFARVLKTKKAEARTSAATQSPTPRAKGMRGKTFVGVFPEIRSEFRGTQFNSVFDKGLAG